MHFQICIISGGGRAEGSGSVGQDMTECRQRDGVDDRSLLMSTKLGGGREAVF